MIGRLRGLAVGSSLLLAVLSAAPVQAGREPQVRCHAWTVGFGLGWYSFDEDLDLADYPSGHGIVSYHWTRRLETVFDLNFAFTTRDRPHGRTKFFVPRADLLFTFPSPSGRDSWFLGTTVGATHIDQKIEPIDNDLLVGLGLGFRQDAGQNFGVRYELWVFHTDAEGGHPFVGPRILLTWTGSGNEGSEQSGNIPLRSSRGREPRRASGRP